MIANTVLGDRLSLLGFGMMRLPVRADGEIDEEKVFEMTDIAVSGGVNYFDTAYPYHGGMSEIVTGRALRRYPRESWNLASKFPGHQIADSYDPAGVFEEQLRKCGVGYFDYYLLHNVYENSLSVYTDPKWGIIEYFIRQKEKGRIRHLGFSSHGNIDCLQSFLDLCGEEMEFCQIQLNYLDWTLQNAAAKYRLLRERNVPVWVMEPLRGGRLCRLTGEQEGILRSAGRTENAAGWAFRFLQGLPGIGMILSGMSSAEQVRENVSVFGSADPLTSAQTELLLCLADSMKNSLPCTACGYCREGCPAGLDIPMLISAYNELRFGPEAGQTPAMQIEALPEDKLPSACIGCGACSAVCPQKIDIPGAMKDLGAVLSTIPSWRSVSEARAKNQRRF